MNPLQPSSHPALDTFLNVISDVTRAEDITHFHTSLKQAAKQLTCSDATSLVLRQGDDCHYIDEESDQPLWKGESFPLSACITGWSMLNATTVIVEDIFKDARIPLALYQGKNIHSLLVVPIDHEHAIGAISVYWKKRHAPSQSEIMQLESLANVSSLIFKLMKNQSELAALISKRTSDLEIANQRLSEMATHDELTGLYNRRGFFLMADQAIRVSERSKMRCAMIFADVDGLKVVNDHYGHHEGDVMLNTVANLLRRHFRKSDIVARMGGDEFAILVIDPEENAAALNERLEFEFNAMNRTDHRPYRIDISFGSVMSELTPDIDLEHLINRADRLMYQAKLSKKMN